MARSPKHDDVSFWRDPDLPGVEIRYSSYGEHAFKKHVHETYSIGVMEHGRTTFVLEGDTFVAEAGHMVVMNPLAVHSCNPDPGVDMTYRMFYVGAEWLEEAAAVPGLDGPPRFGVPVLDDPELADHWRGLHEAVKEGADRLEKQSLLLVGLDMLLDRHLFRGGARPDPAPEGVARARSHLHLHPTDKVGLDELAELAGLSRCHLLRVFQQTVGLPPHAYQTQLRVELAKKLLAQGMPLIDVALEAGFVDQSHFTRRFRAFTGATPRQYQDTLNPA